MRIVGHEIRKIWNIKMLAIVAAICVLYFIAADMPTWLRSVRDAASDEMLIDLVRRHEHPITDDEMDAFLLEWVEIWESTGREWVEYATVHDGWDRMVYRLELAISQELWEWQRQLFADAAATNSVDEIFAMTAAMREPLIAEANMHIANNPIFAAHGIYSYEDFQNRREFPPFYEIEAHRAQMIMIDTLFGQSSNFVAHRLADLEFIEFLVEWYEEELYGRGGVHIVLQTLYLPRTEAEELTDRQRERMIEVLENEEYRGVLHNNMFWDMGVIWTDLSLMLIAASLLLHSTLITTDRVRKIVPLQTHAKIGRRITHRQFAATMISSFMLATLFLGAYAIFLWQANVFVYWNQDLPSFLTIWRHYYFIITFIPMTFGSYILLMAGICYALTMGTAAIAFILSRFSRNLITLTLKVVPAIVVVNLFQQQILPYWTDSVSPLYQTAPFTLWNNLYMRTGIAYLDVILVAAFVVVTIIVAWILARRDKQLEVV